jgi:hypothetical protein
LEYTPPRVLKRELIRAAPAGQLCAGRDRPALTARKFRTHQWPSQTHTGASKTELRVDGKVLAEPVIREPITEGSLQIYLGDQSERENSLAEQVSKPGAKVEVVLSK